MSASTPPPPLRYYCRQHEITSREADALPALDAGSFVEEHLDSTPSSATAHPFSSLLQSFDIRHPSDLAVFLGTPSPTAPPAAAASPTTQFDVTNFLHGHLSDILSGGATIQIVMEHYSGGINLGDDYTGSALEQLMEQLTENDPHRYGTLPAADSAVASLPDVAVSLDMIADEGGAKCAVCTDDFDIGAKVKQLPCNHIFHKDCILPWLDLHSSCPVCRFELPTDSHCEHRRAGGEGSASVEQAAAVTPDTPSPSGPHSPRTGERRLRISLPSPVRAALGCQAEINSPGSQDADQPCN